MSNSIVLYFGSQSNYSEEKKGTLYGIYKRVIFLSYKQIKASQTSLGFMYQRLEAFFHGFFCQISHTFSSQIPSQNNHSFVRMSFFGLGIHCSNSIQWLFLNNRNRSYFQMYYNHFYNSMNFFFPQGQINHYSIQVFEASSEIGSVSENWPSQGNWENQSSDQRNKNKVQNQKVLGIQTPIKISSAPHPFTNTDLSTIKTQQTELQSQQTLIKHSQKIDKSEIYNILRSPQTVLGHSSQGSALFVRMVRQSDQFDKIIRQKQNVNWNDKSFNKETHFKGFEGRVHELEWRDLSSVLQNGSSEMSIVTTPIETTDVKQGTVGDCYFLAAIAALANPSKPERILRLFPSLRLNERGAFRARLMAKGVLQQIVVDRSFPVLKEDGSLLGCSPNKTGEVYAMILEKCWAKLWNSYQRIDGGFPHSALHALSGALTKNYILSAEADTPRTKDAFFAQILNYRQADYVMCAGTGKGTETMHSVDVTLATTQQRAKVALAKGHIYCVSDVFVKGGERRVKVFNPWGFNYDPQSRKTEGEFEVTWDRFVAEFAYLTVCKLHDNANYLSQSFAFEPRKLKFFELSVRKAKTGYFAVTVSETDRKEEAEKGRGYLSVTYVVVRVTASAKGEHYELVTIRSECDFSDHYLELHGLTEGEYLVAVYIADAAVSEELTFGVYSEDSFGFREREAKPKFEASFLPNVLLNYHRSAPQKANAFYPIPQNKGIRASFDVLSHRKARIGFYVLRVAEGERAFQVSFGKTEFEEVGLRVLPPYDKDCFKLVAEPGFESIAVVIVEDERRFRQRVSEKGDLFKMVRGKLEYKQ